MTTSRGWSQGRRGLPSTLHSQTELVVFAIHRRLRGMRCIGPFVFIKAELSFIAAIDFPFQNFSDDSKKNNQLDSTLGTQYFCNH